MPRIDFEAVRTMCLGLKDVTDGTVYGSPALKVRGKMFACLPVNRSAEPESLAVRIPVEQRDELIAAAPKTYYVTEHYVDYPCVLVRLSHIHPDALRDLLMTGWQFVAGRSAPTRQIVRRRGTAGIRARRRAVR